MTNPNSLFMLSVMFINLLVLEIIETHKIHIYAN